MKTFDLKVIVSWFAAVLMALATLINCSKANDGHTCRWSLCPYKGIAPAQHDQAVTNYVGEGVKFSDGWCVDMLHLQYPTEDADQLHDRLFNSKK